MVYGGIDLGGTNIKAAVVREDGGILAQARRPTLSNRPPQEVCADMAATLQEAFLLAGMQMADAAGIGVGCPGTVDGETGIVRYSNNLGWAEFDLRGSLLALTGFSAALGNDANVAALAEAAAGHGKGAQSVVVLTLGTGIGSGVVLDGRLLTGYTGAATELGHTVIQDGGWRCTCGRDGCFESYASARGLIRLTKEAIAVAPQSLLAAMAAERGAVDGRTTFDAAAQGCRAGQAVVDEYIHYLAVGTTNIINIFYPQMICFSGGISKAGDALLAPLREQVYPQVFGPTEPKRTELALCELGEEAGVIGAALLAAQAQNG